MDGENVSKPYDPRSETRSLFNNSKRSDVRFLVDGQTVYGHKMILGMGSPVLDRMFFGDLKEKRDVIEIEDLSLIGFKNALRYIYGFEIDFELFELYDSYMAADKYLLHHFSEAFFEYIKGRLDAKSSCLIYDQLIKIGEREEIPLAQVRTMIIEKSKETLESDHFTQIDRETLISLLSLDELSVGEFCLLAAVSKWIDCEVQRQGLPMNRENRRRVFEPIKGYILFTALKPEKIANRKEIIELLPDEERGSLLLHLLNKDYPSRIELKTPRRAATRVACSVFVTDPLCLGAYVYSKVLLSVNRRVSIKTIHTLCSVDVAGLSLKIQSNGVDLDLKIESLVKDGKRSFSFDPPFGVEPNTRYTLEINHGIYKLGDQVSKQQELNYKGWVVFYLEHPGYQCHCFKGLDFLASD